MVASGVAYVASTLAFTHRMHRTHLDALRLGYENLALLEQVRREREAAERSNLEKSRFLAAASHDLRQPVLAVSLFLGLLTNEKLTAHGRYLVDNIASATAAMGHLFDALLNISRLDAGVIEPRRKWFPLNPLLEQLRAEYAPQAVQRLVAAGQAQQGGGEFGSGAAGRILRISATPSRIPGAAACWSAAGIGAAACASWSAIPGRASRRPNRSGCSGSSTS